MFFDAVFLHEWNLRWRAKASHSSIVLAANAASVTLLKCMNRTSVASLKSHIIISLAAELLGFVRQRENPF